MSNTTKICSNCRLSKPATNDYFHADKHQPDSLHKYCKTCRATLRAKSIAAPKQALAEHEKTIEKAKQVLNNPESSFVARESAERKIRLAEKHRKPYLDEIDVHRREVEARNQAIAEAEKARLLEMETAESDKQTQRPRTHDADGNDIAKKLEFIRFLGTPEFGQTLQEQSAENDLARQAQFENIQVLARISKSKEQE
jgi:hypothetical protein